MYIEDSNEEFMRTYKELSAEGRLKVILKNYPSFPGYIITLKNQIIYNIDADFDYMSSKAREEIAERVQTSSLPDITKNKGITMAEISKAFDTGVIEKWVLAGIEGAETYEMEIRVIYLISKDFNLIDGIIQNLNSSDRLLILEYLERKNDIRTLVEKHGYEYEAGRKRLIRIKHKIKDSALSSLERRCRS